MLFSNYLFFDLKNYIFTEKQAFSNQFYILYLKNKLEHIKSTIFRRFMIENYIFIGNLM